MSETRVIENDGEKIYCILADARIAEQTACAAFHIERKTWSIKPLAMWLKWCPYLDFKEHQESMDVPQEIIVEMKNKQLEFDPPGAR